MPQRAMKQISTVRKILIDSLPPNLAIQGSEPALHKKLWSTYSHALSRQCSGHRGIVLSVRAKQLREGDFKGRCQPVQGEQGGVALSSFEPLVVLVAQAQGFHIELTQITGPPHAP